MRKVLPNPFLQDDNENAFELDADAFLEAIAPGVVPADDDANRHLEEAPSVVATYPSKFRSFDLEELEVLLKLSGLRNPTKR
jgi:hypothetical protein